MKEVTDFGVDLEMKEIDGHITCDCGKEIHFIIKHEKIQQLIDLAKKIMEKK